MPDTSSDDSAVLDLDSTNTLSGIYQALTAYARTVPKAAVANVTFQQQPDVKEGGIWKAWVRLQCYGDLQRIGEVPKDGEGDFLAGVKPDLVCEQNWSAEGLGFAGAVEELRDVVEKHLEQLITQRQQDLQSASEALRVLRNPTELDNMWSTTDNPQDEHPSQEEQ